MKKIILILLSCGSFHMAHADGGTTVGSGGDALRELFYNSKGVAASKIDQLSICSFDSSTPQATSDWIIKNQVALAMDIRLSQHAWVVDSQSTCAFTDHSPQATIYLSYPTCASTSNSIDQATFVLIHESAHHLGIDDEQAADAVARAVLSASIVPNCNSGSGIFDPNICSSAPMSTDDARKYFKPGDTTESVGSYKFYGQITRCDTLSGCQPTKTWIFGTYGWGGTVNQMNLTISSTNVSPYFSTSYSVKTDSNWHQYPVNANQGFLNSSLYAPISFQGPSYRGDLGTLTVTTSGDDANNSDNFRFRKDCLWSKWSKTFTATTGVTEKVDIVLYGTH